MEIGYGVYVKNSAEAVPFYCQVFGLELGYHVKNADGSYFHSELCKNGREMLSVVESSEAQNSFNNVVCLGVTLPDAVSVEKAFHLLKEEGAVKRPLGSLPWSPCCAEVVDRFGVWWYLTAPQHRPDDDFTPESMKE